MKFYQNKKCPKCPDELPTSPIDPRCICNKPTLICIKPGEHIHIICPVHGEFRIDGPPFAYLKDY